MCKTWDWHAFTSQLCTALKWDCEQIIILSLNFFICKMGVIMPPRGQMKLLPYTQQALCKWMTILVIKWDRLPGCKWPAPPYRAL